MNRADDSDIWIFGYGSLVWKTDFPFVEKKTGCIKGFHRRFYQNSIDHRGTQTNPGRVVTLIPSTEPGAKVWGVAYHIDAKEKENVFKYLDFREINGYSRYKIKFYSCVGNNEIGENSIDIILYVADQDNESFAGESHIDELVDQIFNATGKSGRNRDYVYNLADSMRVLFPNVFDDHLFEIEKKLKQREHSEQ